MGRLMRRAGFTLVEVLVTVAIMAVIGLASAAVVNAMMRTSEQSEQAIAQLEQLQYTMLLIEQDIRHIVPRQTSTDFYLLAEENLLAFVRSGWFNPAGIFPRSELQPVVYSIEEDTLWRQSAIFVDVADGEDSFTKRPMLEGVTALEVEFLGYSKELNDQANEFGSSRNIQSQRATGELPPALLLRVHTNSWGVIERVLLLTPMSEVEETQRREAEQQQQPGDGNG
ncbi:MULTISPECIES: type II secretion system minor pseudopilin GspJ [unclassified Idiomarina]|uniref:type II secretion system minor pseudopilin GspJ n=2 Tax=Idiomarinaceae TaxID=267893 RepID=UPI00129C3BC3|nr:type II secretion system minor pseudopilin GspJ [Idiomarina sp. FeN1]NCU60867.1 type II secretion system protein GspJ [Idiomarina sp. FenBw--71]